MEEIVTNLNMTTIQKEIIGEDSPLLVQVSELCHPAPTAPMSHPENKANILRPSLWPAQPSPANYLGSVTYRAEGRATRAA